MNYHNSLHGMIYLQYIHANISFVFFSALPILSLFPFLYFMVSLYILQFIVALQMALNENLENMYVCYILELYV